jgi:hypothetical protein
MRKSTAKDKVQYMIEAMEKVLEFNEKEKLSDSDAHKVCNTMFAEFLVDNMIDGSETIILGKIEHDYGSVVTMEILKKLGVDDKRPRSWHMPHMIGYN